MTPGLLATIRERPWGRPTLSLLKGRKVALPPPFFLNHEMHLAATSSSVTTMLLKPPPSAFDRASSCAGSLGAVSSPKEPMMP